MPTLGSTFRHFRAGTDGSKLLSTVWSSINSLSAHLALVSSRAVLAVVGSAKRAKVAAATPPHSIDALQLNLSVSRQQASLQSAGEAPCPHLALPPSQWQCYSEVLSVAVDSRPRQRPKHGSAGAAETR